MRIFVRAAAVLLAIALAACSAPSSSDFVGTWKVKDGEGNAFQIVLAGDGKASADREGEGMKGTWEEEGSAAVITWDTGWTTKIEKDGDKFKKTAYEKGKTVKDPPTNTSDAEKAG